MRRIALVLIAATVVLSGAACGGDGSSPGATATAPSGSPVPTPTRRAVGPASYCQQRQEPRAAYNVQVRARWEGKDRIVIEGSATLPGAGTVNYLICQDGEVSGSLLWATEPTFKNGKIKAESKLVESEAGPVFDPNARFEVVLSVLGEPVQVPYFTISVPVEGNPG